MRELRLAADHLGLSFFYAESTWIIIDNASLSSCISNYRVIIRVILHSTMLLILFYLADKLGLSVVILVCQEIVTLAFLVVGIR